jgi:hypothetical protein
MDADVQTRPCPRELHGLLEPATGDEHARAREDASVEGPGDAPVHLFAEPEVIGVHDRLRRSRVPGAQPQPIPPHLPKDPQHDSVARRRRLPRHSGVVLDAHFPQCGVQSRRLEQQFRVDERPFAPQPHLVQQPASNELEGEVDIPDTQAEPPADQAVVRPRHNLAPRALRAPQSIPDQQTVSVAE